MNKPKFKVVEDKTFSRLSLEADAGKERGPWTEEKLNSNSKCAIFKYWHCKQFTIKLK